MKKIRKPTFRFTESIGPELDRKELARQLDDLARRVFERMANAVVR